MVVPGRLTQEQRSTEAARCIEEARSRGHFHHYANLVTTLPLLLHQHGLGQTLAHLKARGGDRPTSPYQLLFEQLTRRLGQVKGVSEDRVFSRLTQEDSWHYVQAAEEIRAFALALRRAIQTEKQTDLEGQTVEAPEEEVNV